jgi:F-type H+-transporting ATPase subunit c
VEIIRTDLSRLLFDNQASSRAEFRSVVRRSFKPPNFKIGVEVDRTSRRMMMIKLKLFALSALITLFTVATAMAQAPGATGAADHSTGNSWFFPAMGSFAVGIAALGGALGDGRAIAAACEGTARNPGAGGRIFTMLLLGLALIETLVLFTFLTVVLKY